MRVENEGELIGFGHERSSLGPLRDNRANLPNPGGEFRLESPALQSLQPPQTGGVVMRLALIEHEAIEHGGRKRGAQLEHIGGLMAAKLLDQFQLARRRLDQANDFIERFGRRSPGGVLRRGEPSFQLRRQRTGAHLEQARAVLGPDIDLVEKSRVPFRPRDVIALGVAHEQSGIDRRQNPRQCRLQPTNDRKWQLRLVELSQPRFHPSP